MKNFISKSLKSLLSLAMAFSVVTPFVVETSKAASDEATVDVDGTSVTIGNSYISRTFDITDSVLSTSKISNFRTDGTMELVPQAGSQEFVIELLADAVELEAIDDSNWTVTTTSEYTGDSTGVEGPASNLIDENLNTIWHTAYANGNPVQVLPHSVIFKLDGATEFSCFSYTPRQNGESTNGNVSQYELWISNSTSTTNLADDDASWEKVAEGTFTYNGVNPIYVNLDETKTATQVKFVAVTAKNGLGFGAGAEFNLHKDFYTVSNSGTMNASDMTLDETNPYTITDVTETINGVEKTGVELRFNFTPYTVGTVVYDIDQVVTMYDGDSFMRKHLDISVPTESAAVANISYIDVESMILPESALAENTYWTIPEQANNSDMANMKGDYLELGQPYYVSALYVGSEFPIAENKIRDGKAYSRYWYGKSLAKDQHFDYILNNTAGEMQTWDVVTGAARSTDYLVCQADFYEYIETIATPTDFRQQYNSWYDHMKNISAEIIIESFYEIEKGFTQHGVAPLDSYVVDDGWMNYNSFWDFNDRFPNELYDASLQVNQMGSNFGLWVGPRGGYGTQGTIANYIQNNGLGSKNNSVGDINISDARYCNKLVNDIFVGYQNKFGVNYWKLDGMLLEAATTPSEYYVTGNGFYTFSETYERWTDMFEIMRASGDEDLWINITSYLNPSPWYTQWCNSVWMQNTGDCGYTRTWSSNDASAALTYRDNCYYNFINDRQWQLPNKYFYNHDPVYGLSALNAYGGGTINFSTDQLREYLYMLGTRGTAFWEYYYSFSLFDDDKWDVNAEAANWIEENFDVLQKSKMFGGRPGNGEIYGFSCWNGHEGIVSIRNPKNVEQSYTVTYDRLIGVAEDMVNVSSDVVLGDIKWQNDDTLSYGDQVTYTLGAEEVLVLHFGAKDTTAATIEKVEATSATTVEVTFNEQVRNENLTAISVEGNTVASATLKADKRTVELTLANELVDGQTVNVSANGVKDITGNASNATASDDYFADGVVFTEENVTFNGSETTIEEGKAIDKDKGFTVSGTIKTTSTNATIVKQEGAYEVAIDADGYLTFNVNGVSVNSKYTEKLIVDDEVVSTVKGIIADGVEHQFSCVKEVNGMIKIYIDGVVVASAYDENNANPMLEKGTVTLGNQLVGKAAYITLTDSALAYDEVAALYEDADIDTTRKPLDDANFTATANVDTGEGDIANIWDGDPTTYWASPATTTTVEKGNPAVTVDLGSVYTIDQVNYTKRYHNGDGTQWCCTGNIREYVLEVSTDGTNWTTVSVGPTFDDESYTSMGDGGTTEITFAPTEAKYIRISATATYHWKDGVTHSENLLNTVMTIGDLAVFEWHYEIPVLDDTNLINKAANEVEVESYSSQCGGTGEPTENGYGQASTTVDYNNASYWHSNWESNNGEQHTITYDLGKAYTVTDVTFLPRQGNSRNGDIHRFEVYVGNDTDYTNNTLTGEYVFAESGELNPNEWYRAHLAENGEFEGRYVTIRVTGSYGDSGNDKFASMAEIRFYGTTDAVDPEPSVDKTALAQAIADAEAIDTTNYTDATVTALTSALDAAKVVNDNADATQEEVNAAVEALNAAIAALEEKPATPTVDKAALAAAIADAKALNADDYTEATFTAVTTALAAAETVNADENATQEAVDAAVKALTDAIAALEEKEEPAPLPTMDFYDVQDEKAWFYGSVEKAFQKGLMGATGKAPVDGKPWFEPDTNISRGMVATVLYRMAGKPKVEFKATFSDVKDANLWYSTAITWAAENRVVSGYKDGSFGPDDNITRQDLAIMLRNYAKAAGLDTNVTVDFAAFKDGKEVVDYAASAVAWCVEAKLMSGSVKADGTYLMPTANATRAECAKMFSLLDDAIKANAK